MTYNFRFICLIFFRLHKPAAEMESQGRRPGWRGDEKDRRPFSRSADDFGGILDPQEDSDDRVMKGFGISFLLLILLSGSLGEKGENREDENVRGVGIANSRERRKLSTYNREKDKTTEGGKPLSRGGKGEKRESRNLLGSLLLLPQAPHTPHLLQQAPHRRQPLRLPGVGTPRGFIQSKLRCWWQYWFITRLLPHVFYKILQLSGCRPRRSKSRLVGELLRLAQWVGQTRSGEPESLVLKPLLSYILISIFQRQICGEGGGTCGPVSRQKGARGGGCLPVKWI